MAIRQPFGADADTLVPLTNVNVGTVATLTGLSVVEQGNAIYHKTILTLTGVAVGSATGAAALGFGKLVYTLPAGAQVVKAINMSVALTGVAAIVADTPKVAIGSVIASGAVATMTTATFMDYVTEQTSGAISGANVTTKLAVATAGALAGIAINEAASAKTIHLNVADTWAAAGAVTATGTITILWEFV